jgi:hypothetical protein
MILATDRLREVAGASTSPQLPTTSLNLGT